MPNQRFATRDELIRLLGEDADERAVLDIVLTRLANHGVDVNALVKITAEAAQLLAEAVNTDADAPTLRHA